MGKYRIDKEELHKKKIGKKTLEEIIVSKYQITMGVAASVYHYTSVEGLIGILKNREIFFLQMLSF